jgi:putative alpha-1,2-mannosidase
MHDHHFEGMNNESDMETPYCYLWVGRSDRLAEVCDLVRRCGFDAGPGGCPGNNDSGGLSSWYVWCCLGIYPLTGTPYYLLGSPSVNSAEIKLSGAVLKIEVRRKSANSIYPAGYEFNGRKFVSPWLAIADVEKGGTLVFELGDNPVTPSPIPDWL